MANYVADSESDHNPEVTAPRKAFSVVNEQPLSFMENGPDSN